MQPTTKRVVDTKGFGAVALPLEREHQQPVAGLAIGGDLHERPGRPFGRMELTATDLKACLRRQLETPLVRVAQMTTVLVEPRRLLAVQQLARGDVLDDPRWSPGGCPLLAIDCPLGSVQRLGHRLDVDPGVRSQGEPKLRAPLQREPPAKLGNER